MHAPCSGSGCAVHGFWSALDIAFGLLILIFLTRQRCEREQWSELKSREKPIGLVSLALGTGSVDGERRKIPIRIFERTERTPCLPSVIIYRYFFYRQWASCVQFLCACAKEPRYFPDRGIGRSTDCELTRAARPTPGKIARGATQLRGFDPGPAAGPGGGRRAGYFFYRGLVSVGFH